jgi:solute carrier family 35 protein E3
MGFVVVNEATFSSTGFVWAVIGVVSTSVAQIFFAPLQKDLGLNAMQLLFHLSPWMTFGSFIIIPLFEDIEALKAVKVTGSVISNITLSCLMAVLLNITNYLVLGWASPLTYQVIGHMKTIIILLAGALQYDSIPQGKTRIGMVLAIVGCIVYTEENRQQQLRRSTRADMSSLPSTHFNQNLKSATASEAPRTDIRPQPGDEKV